MSYNASLRERIRYRTDNFLGRGSGALFLALLIAFMVSLVAIIGVRAVLHVVTPDEETSFLRQIWYTYLQITDPGNMAQDNATPTIFKVVAIAAGMTAFFTIPLPSLPFSFSLSRP